MLKRRGLLPPRIRSHDREHPRLTKYLSKHIGAEENVTVTVTDAREHCSGSGTDCIVVEMRNREGQTATHYFGRATEASLRILASFAKACGLSKEEIEGFEPSMLVGKTVEIDFALNEQQFIYAKRWRLAKKEDSTGSTTTVPSVVMF